MRGLAVGAPVELFGIQIGNVTDIRLEFDPSGAKSRVAVRMEIQPERIMQPDQRSNTRPIDVARKLVARGLRVQLQTANFLTGQLLAALDVFVPDAPPAEVGAEGEGIVLPSVPGGLDSITAGVSELATKLTRLPLDEIAKNLNDTLRGASGVTNGPELKQVLASLANTMADVQRSRAHDGCRGDPRAEAAARRSPQGLQAGVDRAGRLVGSVDTGLWRRTPSSAATWSAARAGQRHRALGPAAGGLPRPASRGADPRSQRRGGGT